MQIPARVIRITNPGEPVVPVERFIDGYQSRNERLADLMRRFGVCEEKSSGVDRVVEAVEFLQLPAPDLRVATQLGKVDPNAANRELRTFGTLGVLRHELRDRGTRFKLCQFKPEHDLNPDTLSRYQ